MDRVKDYIQSKSARLDEWKEDIARMKKKIRREGVDRGVRAQIDSLERRERAVRNMVESLKEVGKEDVKAVKSGVEQAWSQLHKSFQEASRTLID